MRSESGASPSGRVGSIRGMDDLYRGSDTGMTWPAAFMFGEVPYRPRRAGLGRQLTQYPDATLVVADRPDGSRALLLTQQGEERARSLYESRALRRLTNDEADSGLVLGRRWVVARWRIRWRFERLETRRKLDALLDAGIRSFFDLTEEGELLPYDDMLRELASDRRIAVAYERVPIPDLGVPRPADLQALLSQLEVNVSAGTPSYVALLGRYRANRNGDWLLAGGARRYRRQ